MKTNILVFSTLTACFIGCGEDTSRPTEPVGDFESSIAEPAAKAAQSDRAMREFERARDKVSDILRDIKRYIQKDPNADRHAEKVRKLSKDLERANRRLDKAFRSVRNNPAAQATMRSLGEYMGSVLTRLQAYRPTFLFIINPCGLPLIGEYLCPYMPGQGPTV